MIKIGISAAHFIKSQLDIQIYLLKVCWLCIDNNVLTRSVLFMNGDKALKPNCYSEWLGHGVTNECLVK